MLVNHRTANPWQHAAETGYADPRKTPEKLRRAGWRW